MSAAQKAWEIYQIYQAMGDRCPKMALTLFSSDRAQLIMLSEDNQPVCAFDIREACPYLRIDGIRVADRRAADALMTEKVRQAILEQRPDGRIRFFDWKRRVVPSVE